MKHLGQLEVISQPHPITVDKNDLRVGVNDVGDHFIRLNDEGEIDYIIDKVCDHAGGRLILRGDQAVCPMHGWSLDTETLNYKGAHVKKQPIAYGESEGKITFSGAKHHLENPFRPSGKGEVSVRWLNHATVYIECNGVSIITDPWLFGPAFMTGWWLANPSPADAIDLLKKADYVYVSHNHPDHLHAETLAVLPKDATFLAPAFTTRSVEKYLRSLGFRTIIPLEFNNLFEPVPGLQISMLKSGDFRDDSGMYLCANGQQILLTVDANYLNSHVLPVGLDLLMTSFAGGASGFPLCFDNYSEGEKKKIVRRNSGSSFMRASQYIEITRPANYVPYAGMFTEAAPRDDYVRENNRKNKFDAYQAVCVRTGTRLVQARADETLVFGDEGLKISKQPATYLRREDPAFYIKALREEYPLDFSKLTTYFEACSFRGDQVLQIIPADDDFEPLGNAIYFADFKNRDFGVIDRAEMIISRPGCRVMQMKVRPEVLMCVVENKLPWEDISIGFQMRVERTPNEYESDFWYYFTNVYIGEKDFRYSSFCGACTVVEQNPIWAAEIV